MSPSSKQNVIIVVVALLFIGGAILTTLFFSGRLDDVFNNAASKDQGYQNITLTDAELTCTKEVKEKFGKSLADLILDSHSSRYSKSDFAYRVYLKAKTVDKKQNMMGYYINCYVHAGHGRLTKFEVHEDQDAPEK